MCYWFHLNHTSSATGTRVQICDAGAEPSFPAKILIPHTISSPINLSVCPLKTLKHYVQMTVSRKDTDQLFVIFGEQYKDRLAC